jgi:hypothetical protein
MIQKLIRGVVGQRADEREAELYRSLIRHEAKLGGTVFGPIPEGHRREFFCLDEHTWIWHEEWLDENGQHQIRTTRYDIRPDGLLKSQNGTYQKVSRDEALRFRKAAHLYADRLNQEMYNGAIAA